MSTRALSFLEFSGLRCSSLEIFRAKLTKRQAEERQAAILPEVQRLPEFLVREADQVVDLGPAERSGPELDLSNTSDVDRRVMRIGDEATPVQMLTRDD